MNPTDLNVEEIVQQGYDEMPSKQFHNTGHARRVHDAALALGSVTGEDRIVLRVAAAYHDVGHSSGASGHEERSANRAEEVLLSRGMENNSRFIERVKNAIISTKMRRNGSHPMVGKGGQIGKILADADVHNFGLPWDKFRVRTNEVRKEVDEGMSEEEWFKSTIDLLDNHSWHAGGGSVYGNKQHNIDRMRSEIEER